MGIKLNYPIWLLILPFAYFFILLIAKKITYPALIRKKIVVSIRLIIVTALVLVMCQLGLKTDSGQTTTIFVVDNSDSVQNKSIGQNIVKQALKNKTSKDKFGIVTFGADTHIDTLPQENGRFSGIKAITASDFTNIEEALKVSTSLIPQQDKKRIVLISDGQETTGDSLKFVKTLKQQNITLDAFPIINDSKEEVLVSELNIPKYLKLSESFEINIKIKSTVKTTSNLKIYSGNKLLAQKQIEINPGENNLAFSDNALINGVNSYTAEIEPAKDSIIENNKKSSYIFVDSKAKLLVLQDEKESASQLTKIFGPNMELTITKPEAAPQTADELAKYDGVFISDIPVERMKESFLKNLDLLVRETGKGLLVSGGKNSYAPGGYFKTILETMLPVNMEIKPKDENPNLGLVLVIDKSGSMSEGNYGISKVELAKESAKRSSEILKSSDTLGVIAFDDAAQWIVKPRKVDDLNKIHELIGTIRADGGTQIIPPLREAYLALKDSKTRLKHIILLTDGQSERIGYDELLKSMKEANITLSTVAVGQSADKQLLNFLAITGGGRFYVTDEFTDIPKIFAKETILASNEYLNNRTFQPVTRNYSTILKGITAIPTLDGYVATTAKTGSTVVLESDQQHPVLVYWHYGLGNVVAWTPDTNGMWTKKWFGWNQSNTMWNNVGSFILQKKFSDDVSITTLFENGKDALVLSSGAEDVTSDTAEVTAISPAGNKQSITLKAISPSLFKGNYKKEEPGVYTTKIELKTGNTVNKIINSCFTINYSMEYDVLKNTGGTLLKSLTDETGGQTIVEPGKIFQNKLENIESTYDVSQILLILSIFLILLEISVRRLVIWDSIISKAIDFKNMVIAKNIVTAKNKLKTNPKVTDESKFIISNNLDVGEAGIGLDQPLTPETDEKGKIKADSKESPSITDKINKNNIEKTEDSYIKQLIDRKNKYKG